MACAANVQAQHRIYVHEVVCDVYVYCVYVRMCERVHGARGVAPVCDVVQYRSIRSGLGRFCRVHGLLGHPLGQPGPLLSANGPTYNRPMTCVSEVSRTHALSPLCIVRMSYNATLA